MLIKERGKRSLYFILIYFIKGYVRASGNYLIFFRRCYDIVQNAKELEFILECSVQYVLALKQVT